MIRRHRLARLIISSPWEEMRNLSVMPSHTQDMGVAQAADLQKRLHVLHETSEPFQAVVRSLRNQTVTDTKANLVQAVNRAVAKGRDPLTDPAVQQARSKLPPEAKWDNEGNLTLVPFDDERLQSWAQDSHPYQEAFREAPRTQHLIYRGESKGFRIPTPGSMFSYDVPTSFSEDRSVAAYYSSGVLIEVLPGAPYLSAAFLKGADEGPEGGIYQHRSIRDKHKTHNSVYYSASMETDMEVLSMGDFQVVGQRTEDITYQDQKTGKTKTKSFKIVTLKPA
jgi:hypothetical protein